VSNQPTASLAQCIVEALDMRGLTTLLANSSMALGPKNGCIGLPEISVADRALAVDCTE
jgi:hypothetical protein